ncbi:hypothetical protein P43SY_001211 [Pythium insidiosum]|uniref:Serine protease n=1 Tax=Pythium insidiosum TaxID=114742 RepID=A0AAD5Q8U9_PYTIN|nr:hypothetical protein P43SY_001211 [Pythium insidiosum]
MHLLRRACHAAALLLASTICVRPSLVRAQSSALTGALPLDLRVGCGASTPYGGDIAPPSPTQVTRSYWFVVEHPIAQFISLHFAEFNLPKDDVVVIRATKPDDSETTQLRYRGSDKSGAFFSMPLFTKSVTIELYTSGEREGMKASECVGFVVDEFRFLAQESVLGNSTKEEICGGGDDSNEAACFRGQPQIYRRAKPIARLLTQKGRKSFFCSAWLVGCEGHMLTNHHCISNDDEAINTVFEFGGEGDTCDVKCNRAFGCRSKQRFTGRLIAADEELDYALIKLDVNPVDEYGFLQMRESGAELSERIYIPQHPSGWGKRVAVKTDDGEFGQVVSLTRGGCAVDQVAYYLDTRGGSSGSPVIGWRDHTVVALHHCGPCPNTAINMNKIVPHLRARFLLPECSLSSDGPDCQCSANI